MSHGSGAIASGVEEYPCRGGSVKLTVEVAAGKSNVSGRVRLGPREGEAGGDKTVAASASYVQVVCEPAEFARD
jgi:hypothetical protein